MPLFSILVSHILFICLSPHFPINSFSTAAVIPNIGSLSIPSSGTAQCLSTQNLTLITPPRSTAIFLFDKSTITGGYTNEYSKRIAYNTMVYTMAHATSFREGIEGMALVLPKDNQEAESFEKDIKFILKTYSSDIAIYIRSEYQMGDESVLEFKAGPGFGPEVKPVLAAVSALAVD